MKKNLLFLVCISFSWGCDIVKFGKGVQKDTARIIKNNKSFIKELSFEGVIKEKLICPKCEEYKYEVLLNIKNYTPQSTISNNDFLPYYRFKNDSSLLISVNKKIYDFAEINNKINKTANSDNLIILKSNVKTELNWLSREDSSWLFKNE